MRKVFLYSLFFYAGLFYAQCDTALVSRLLKMSFDLSSNNTDSSLLLGRMALDKAKPCGDNKLIARSYFMIGEAYDYKNEVDSAEAYYVYYLNYARLAKDSLLASEALNMIGSTYIYRSDFPTALSYCIRGLKLAETYKNDKLVAGCLGNIGNIYYFQRRHEEALDFWKRSLVLYKKLGITKNIIILLANIGAHYNEKEDFGNAILYLNESLEYTLKANDKHGAMSAYINIGNAYLFADKVGEAISYYKKAWDIALVLHDKYNMLYCLNNLGDCYVKLSRYKEAEIYFNRALELEAKYPFPQARLTSNYGLFTVHDSLRDYKKAVSYLLLYKDLKDSLLSSENQEQINELQTRYQTEKKDQENKLLAARNKLSEETIRNQNIVTWFLAGGVALALLLILAVYRSYRLKKKDNIIIRAQKQEVELKNSIIEHQKAIVEEKQKEILDSIHYAKRIQTSLLPNEKYITRVLGRLKK